MTKFTLLAAVTGLMISWVAHVNAEALALDPNQFKSGLDASAGESMWVEGDALVLQLGSQSDPKGMHRALLDLPVQPNSCYVFSADIAVESGNGGITCHLATKEGKWTDICGEGVSKDNSGTYSVQINAGADQTTLRISLGISGTNAKVLYRNPKLVRVMDIGWALKPLASLPALHEIPGSEAWKDAVKLAPFRVLGKPDTVAKEDSQAFITTDGKYLMVGFRFEEPDMKGIKADIKTDDDISIYQDDSAQVFLSTNQASFVNCMANSAGTKYWGQRCDKTRLINRDWYSTDVVTHLQYPWDAKTTRYKDFWTCVMKAKLSDLLAHEPSGTETVYLNLTRHRQRGNAKENLTWAPLTGKDWLTPRFFLPVILQLPENPAAAKAEPTKEFKFTNLLGAAPSLFLPGQPVKLVKRKGKALLPSSVKIVERIVSLPDRVKQLLADNCANPSGSNVVVSLEVRPDAVETKGLSESALRRLKSPEAFSLVLAGDQTKITARTKEGVLRGLATYILMVRRASALSSPSLPNLSLLDGPAMDYRGWLIGGKNADEVKRMIDVAFLLRLNKVVISTDSWGGPTSFPFTVAKIGGKDYTKEDWVVLFKRAREYGMEPIPYFSAWSRIEYLTNHSEYAHLGEPVPPNGQKEFKVPRNLDVANDEAVQLALSLQGELIDSLAPTSLHIAFDELTYLQPPVPLGTSEKARALGWQSFDWIQKALTVNTEYLNNRNVDIHLWGDMLDPSHNGKSVGLKNPEPLAKLPKNMIIYDWKYGQDSNFPSIKMFMDAGFKKVVGCPWAGPLNIEGMARSVKNYGAWGMCQTSWNNCDPEQMGPELRRALALTSNFSWSAEGCDLSRFTWIPDAVFELASRKPRSWSGAVRPITAPENLLSPEKLIAQELNFSADASLDFLLQTVCNVNGAGIRPFKKEGRPAAIIVRGQSKDSVTLPINSKAKRLVFLHSLNRQTGYPDNLDAMPTDRRFHAQSGVYRIHYADGSQAEAKLVFRTDIGDPNDSGLGRGMTPALFGTLSRTRFFNLPTYEWVNPSPEKPIASVEILPGALEGMDILLYGLSAELQND